MSAPGRLPPAADVVRQLRDSGNPKTAAHFANAVHQGEAADRAAAAARSAAAERDRALERQRLARAIDSGQRDLQRHSTHDPDSEDAQLVGTFYAVVRVAVGVPGDSAQYEAQAAARDAAAREAAARARSQEDTHRYALRAYDEAATRTTRQVHAADALRSAAAATAGAAGGVAGVFAGMALGGVGAPVLGPAGAAAAEEAARAAVARSRPYPDLSIDPRAYRE